MTEELEGRDHQRGLDFLVHVETNIEVDVTGEFPAPLQCGSNFIEDLSSVKDKYDDVMCIGISE